MSRYAPRCKGLSRRDTYIYIPSVRKCTVYTLWKNSTVVPLQAPHTTRPPGSHQSPHNNVLPAHNHARKQVPREGSVACMLARMRTARRRAILLSYGRTYQIRHHNNRPVCIDGTLPKLPPRTQPLHTSDTLDDVVIPPSTRPHTATPLSKCAAGRRGPRFVEFKAATSTYLDPRTSPTRQTNTSQPTCIDGIRLKSRCACFFLCTRYSFHGFQR